MQNPCSEQLKKYTKEWHQEQQQSRSINAFTHGPTLWQLGSILIFVLLTVQFFVMVSFVGEFGKKVGLIVGEVLLVGVVGVVWFWVSVVDPADPVHTLHCKSIL